MVKQVGSNDPIHKNIQQSLATQLQQLSSTFRKQQTSYLNKLRAREGKSQATQFRTEAKQADEEELDSVYVNNTGISRYGNGHAGQ